MTTLGVAAEPHDDELEWDRPGIAPRLLGDVLADYVGDDEIRDRNRLIFEMRYYNPRWWTFARIGRRFGLSDRQIFRVFAEVARYVELECGRPVCRT